MKIIFLILALTDTVMAGGGYLSDGVSRAIGDSAYVNVNGDTMTGQLTLSNSTLTVTGPLGVNVSYGINAATGVFTNTGAASLDIGGGLNAGTGNVAIIDATGKITALSSTYFADLSGANLTTLTAANISAGSLGAGVIASSVAVDGVYTNAIFSSAVTDAKLATGITSSKLTGALPAISGASLTNLTAANIDAGSLGVSVLASSVAIGAFYSTPNIRTNLGLAIGTDVQAYDADLADLADGSLTGSLVGAGVPAANVAAGTFGAGVLIPPAGVDLSTVTANHVLKTGDTMTGQMTNISSMTITGNGGVYGLQVSSNISLAGILFSVNSKLGIDNASPTTILHVGAGTDAPSVAAQISANMAGTAVISAIDSTNNVETAMRSSSAGAIFGTVSNHTLFLRTNDSNVVTILASGNTGIGVVTPQATLDVAGGIGSYSRTIAQLLAIAPLQVGVQYFCNNCSPAKMVVSTGTSAGNFAAIDGGTFQ